MDGTAPARRVVIPATAGIQGSPGSRPAPGRQKGPTCLCNLVVIALRHPVPNVWSVPL